MCDLHYEKNRKILFSINLKSEAKGKRKRRNKIQERKYFPLNLDIVSNNSYIHFYKVNISFLVYVVL